MKRKRVLPLPASYADEEQNEPELKNHVMAHGCDVVAPASKPKVRTRSDTDQSDCEVIDHDVVVDVAREPSSLRLAGKDHVADEKTPVPVEDVVVNEECLISQPCTIEACAEDVVVVNNDASSAILLVNASETTMEERTSAACLLPGISDLKEEEESPSVDVRADAGSPDVARVAHVADVADIAIANERSPSPSLVADPALDPLVPPDIRLESKDVIQLDIADEAHDVVVLAGVELEAQEVVLNNDVARDNSGVEFLTGWCFHPSFFLFKYNN